MRIETVNPFSLSLSSLLPNLVASDSPPSIPTIPTTMSNIANEKGSIINYSNNMGDEHHHGHGGNSASALPAATYVHNTTPQLRVIGNPGPL